MLNIEKLKFTECPVLTHADESACITKYRHMRTYVSTQRHVKSSIPERVDRQHEVDNKSNWQLDRQRAWCDHYGSELWKVKNKQCCKEMSERVTAHSNGHYDREIDRLRIRWINELSVVCTQAICYASIRRMYVRLLPKCCGKGKEQTSISANNSIMKV